MQPKWSSLLQPLAISKESWDIPTWNTAYNNRSHRGLVAEEPVCLVLNHVAWIWHTTYCYIICFHALPPEQKLSSYQWHPVQETDDTDFKKVRMTSLKRVDNIESPAYNNS